MPGFRSGERARNRANGAGVETGLRKLGAFAGAGLPNSRGAKQTE